MTRVLIRNIDHVLPLTRPGEVLRGHDILVEGPAIAAIGPGLQAEAERVIDGSGMAALPGMVNTHHHLYQTLTRGIPRMQDAELFDWLIAHYEVWRELGAEALDLACRVGLSELLLTGCTTSADHHYLFPGGQAPDLIDVTIAAARDLGIRFHPTRGSMSLGRSRGGLPPDDVIQDEETIERDSIRLLGRYHDPARFSMCRLALAPCSPFSVTLESLERTARLAREHGVRLHTHLAETLDEERFCREKFGVRPVGLMERVGWLGPDVWFAHCVHLDEAEIRLFGATGTGVAHCPGSNMRLASGIAPVPELLAAGAPVGLAVDGSASNDAGDMRGEARLAMLLARVQRTAGAMGAWEALELATGGGARVLGRDDIGRLAPGMAADIVLYDMRRVPFAGAMSDPAAALIFTGTVERAHTVLVNGRPVVEAGAVAGLDEAALTERHNRAAARLIENAGRRTGIDFLARPTARGAGA